MSRKHINLSITDALSYGWKATSKYLGFYFTLALIILLFNLIPSIFTVFFDNSIYTPVIRGIFIVLMALITLGMVRTTLQQVDKKLSIGKSFEESAKLVEGYEWDLLSYWLIMILLNIVGILFFVVGIVITLPVTVAGYTYLYRELRK